MTAKPSLIVIARPEGPKQSSLVFGRRQPIMVRDMKQPAVYIMANKRNGTLYTGVTSELVRRVHQHREGLLPGFTSRYGCKLLVWYERCDEMAGAIAREKQIKAGTRRSKLKLIEALNPDWRDLWPELM